MTSGGGICSSSSVTAWTKAAAPSGVEAPRGMTYGRRPARCSCSAAASISMARALTRGDVSDLCAEQACQERIGRRTLRLRAVDDEDAAKSQPRGGSGGDARVIRLHAAARDERIGLAGDGVGGHQPHLAHFVAAERKPDRVVALDEQAWAAAESVPEAVQLLDRRWSGRKRNRRQRGERAEHPAMISMDCVAGTQVERDPAGCAATS